MGCVSTGMGDCFSALLVLSDGFTAPASRPKPLSALFILHVKCPNLCLSVLVISCLDSSRPVWLDLKYNEVTGTWQWADSEDLSWSNWESDPGNALTLFNKVCLSSVMEFYSKSVYYPIFSNFLPLF